MIDPKFSPRLSNLRRQLDKNRGGGLIDVPHLALLHSYTPDEMIAQFRNDWGNVPEGVVLPVATADGLLFPVDGLNEPMSQFASGFKGGHRDFQSIVHAFATAGLDVYLLVDPTMGFIRTDSLQIVDILGIGSTALCISNPRSQDVIAAVLMRGIDLAMYTTRDTQGKLKGVVFDAVNLWPTNATEMRIELTCFCPSCKKYFDEQQPGLVSQFKTYPNPWNLVMEGSDAGLSVVNDIHPSSDPSDIVGLARQRGLDEVFSDRSEPFLLGQASTVLQYISLRHSLTVAAIGDIFRQALDGLDSMPRRIILTEGGYYDWTSGLQLERLDQPPSSNLAYDEIWFDPSSTELVMKCIPFRSYMCRGARYHIDAFFSVMASAMDPVRRATTGFARASGDDLREMLSAYLSRAMGAFMGGFTSLASLPDLHSDKADSTRVGFVGAALTRDSGQNLIKRAYIPRGAQDRTT